MSDKVFSVTVVKDLFVTFRNNLAQYYFVFLGIIVCDYALLWFQSLPADYSVLGSSGSFAVGVLGYSWFYQRVMHRTLSSLRGQDEPFGKEWKFILGLVALVLLSQMLGFMVGVLPATLMTAWAANPELWVYSFGLLKSIVAYWFLLRFGFILPAIAVGDRYDFLSAWKMGKKHNIKLMLFTLPSILSAFGLGVVLLVNQQDGMTVLLNPFVIAASLTVSIIGAFTLIGYTVWYEKLRLRYEAMSAAPALDEAQPAE